MGKLKTPDWVLEGYKSKNEYERAKGIKNKSVKEKSYKIKICPKCKSSNVRVLLGGEEGKGSKRWECLKCRWNGKSVNEKEISEDEFLEYIDRMEK